MPKIIMIHGKAHSGKSTCASFLKNRGYIEHTFAEPIRRMVARIVFGDDSELSMKLLESNKNVLYRILGNKTPRTAMQLLGTEWGRDMISYSLWVDRVIYEIYRHHGHDFHVISDFRMENEYTGIVSEFGVENVTVIHIVRGDDGGISAESAKHLSEAGIPDYIPRIVIRNDGSIGELEEKILALIDNV